jgi:hypothetical protein
MRKEELRQEVGRVRDSLGTLLEIRGVYYDGQNITILGSPWFPMEDWQDDVTRRLSEIGYNVRFDQNGTQTIMELSRIGKVVKPSLPWVNIILFFLTVLTTFATGAFMESQDIFKNPLLIYRGATFAVPLLLILKQNKSLFALFHSRNTWIKHTGDIRCNNPLQSSFQK